MALMLLTTKHSTKKEDTKLYFVGHFILPKQAETNLSLLLPTYWPEVAAEHPTISFKRGDKSNH